MTTPKDSLKDVPKKDIIGIMAAHKIEYIATLSVAYPEDFIRKVKKAMEIRGTKFFHILAPCPSGWLSKAEDSIKIARMVQEIQSGVDRNWNTLINKESK